MAEESLQRGPERTLHEAIKVEPGLNLRAQDVGLARARRYVYQEELHMGSRTSPTGRSVL